MISKIQLKNAFILARNIAYFSKDPFQRFNKNKPKVQEQNSNTNNEVQQKSNAKIKPQTLKSSPKDQPVDKRNRQKTRIQQIRQKRQQQLRSSEQDPIDQKTKLQQSENTIKNDPNKDREVNNQQLASGFNRFKKTQKRADLKNDAKFNHKEQKDNFKQQHNTLKDEKKSSYIKIDLQQGTSQSEQTQVLRKNQKNKQNIQPPPQSSQQKNVETQKIQPQVLKNESNAQEKSIWTKFQQQILNKKILNNKLLRVQRKILEEMMKNDKKQSAKVPPMPIKIQPKDHRSMLVKGVIAGLFVVLLSSNKYFVWRQGIEKDPQQLTKMLEQNRVAQTWIHNMQTQTDNDQHSKGKNFKKFIYVRQRSGEIFYCNSNEQFERIWLGLVESKNLAIDKIAGSQIIQDPYAQNNNRVIISQNQEYKKSNLLTDTRNIFSFVLFYFFVKSILDMSKKSKGGRGNIGNPFDAKKSHRFKQAIKTTFKDVVGMQKAKFQIVQFIDFLRNPAKYKKLGAKIPKGALLTGPPGTGKTMIAKACAGQSKVPFFTISGSQFIEMYVGVGAQRVRDLFKEAKQSAPSIIFIDEIDAVGKKRSGMGGGGNDERDTTLNQILVEMDGFDVSTNVIVFAATNQKEVLDAALTRPGRFDRMIQIDLPDLQGRKEIFQVHLKPVALDQNIQIDEYARRLATLTPGFSGADIKNVCNEAAIIAARNNKQHVSVMDFELATERIIGGVQKKSQLITQETRKIVAYHQCGHGVVSWFIQNANPLLKLTIIPRSKGALGFAQYLPNEHQMFTKAKLIDEICVILGGRVAEQVFFGKVSTGASDDLKKAYDIAKKYVTQFGFGQKVGWLQYTETQYTKQYSKQTEDKIDQEIQAIMDHCSKITKKIVGEKKELIHNLASKLLQLQTIDQIVIEGILGKRPFKLSKQHEEYIKEKKKMAEEISSEIKVIQETSNAKTKYIL